MRILACPGQTASPLSTSTAQTRVFYELYRDRDAFEEHESQPHVRRFLAEREQYLDSFDVSVLSLLVVKGLPDPKQGT
jgi:quinol monooxygenase YgiN